MNVALSLCDRSGNMLRPWAEAGYQCVCVDIQHSIRKDREEKVGAGLIRYVWGDVRTWTPPAWMCGHLKFVAAFPPCTHVAVSGARDFKKKGTAMLRDSLELFSACWLACVWSGAKFMLENPVGKFSDHMNEPDYYFQPWEYGDLWTKKTCLWTGGGFVMPKPIHSIEPEGTTNAIWKMPPSDDRADLRSETPPNFARAVWQANDQQILNVEAA